MTSQDPLFGPILAVVYRSSQKIGNKSNISSILISSHGTSGFLNVTLDEKSRFYVACQNLPEDHRNSLVRKALAVSCLRAFATMDSFTRAKLISAEVERTPIPTSGSQFSVNSNGQYVDNKMVIFDWDETAAGSLASRFRLADGKYPREIGQAILNTGVIEPKLIQANAIDVVYEDDDQTIDNNNELVYLLGEQLEQLFDPLTEYSPEHTERLYNPPLQNESYATLSDETELVRTICEELYLLQSHMRVDLMDFLHEFLIPLRVQVLGEEEEFEANGGNEHQHQQQPSNASEGDNPDTPRKLRQGRMTIRKLNTIFPPTIDEVVRINNIFYDALQQALSFGSYEVLKACGTTIPYFYKACMRHEAATKNLSRNLNYHLAALHQRCPPATAKKYTPRRIESILQSGLHLTKIKMILDRLMKTKEWSPEEKPTVDEYYQSAVGTIDAFGKQHSVAPYERFVFTPTGKILVEVASGWPKELEYGWLNRRVVCIFDAVNVLAEDTQSRDRHAVIILFTDSLVILEPKKPIPMVSASGLHIPSVADMLMHSMINEVPLRNVPEMAVVAWSKIENVHFSEYNKSKNLSILASGDGFSCSDGVKRHLALYELIRPDYTATKIVELVAKAKITNKTQPFHLFRTTRPQLKLYSTVHELEGYVNETRKSPIAVFLNLEADKATMKAHNLAACINVQFLDTAFVKVKSLSFMEYGQEKVVHKSQFADTIASEVSYLFTLFLSSANETMIDCIVSGNQLVTNFLVNYALNPSVSLIEKQKSHATSLHKRYMVTSPRAEIPTVPAIAVAPITSTKSPVVTSPAIASPPVVSPTVVKQENSPVPVEEEILTLEPPSKIAASQEKRRVSPVQFLKQKVVKSGTTNESIQKKKSFNFLRGILGTSEPPMPVIEPLKIEQPKPVQAVNPAPQPMAGASIELTAEPSMRSVSPASISSPFSQASSPYVGYTRPQKGAQIKYKPGGNIASDDEDYEDWEDMSSDGISIVSDVTSMDNAEEQQQRDVEEWFNNISEDDGDLDSVAPEFDDMNEQNATADMTVEDDDEVKSIQLTKFLDPVLKDVYNRHARNGSYARVRDTGSNPDTSMEIGQSEHETLDTLNFEDDFSYLAGLVGDEDTKTTNLEELPTSDSRRLYPDLRDSSVIFLSSYIRSSKDSTSGSFSAGHSICSSIEVVRVKRESSWESMGTSSNSSGQQVRTMPSVSELGIPMKQSYDDLPRPSQYPARVPSSGKNSLAHSRRNPSLQMRFEFPPRPQAPPPPLPVISPSFRRMINASSVNTLQLASFTVQIDRTIQELTQLKNWSLVREFQRTKRTVMQLYEMARMPVPDVVTLARTELEIRKVVTSTVWIMLSFAEQDPARSSVYHELFGSLLEMEWLRRNKILENLGDTPSIDIWTTN
ncbi:Bud3p [Sugiyamaella lignohabitans]|uniref:Bud3p n=1 Tax=Sugiyamaella lignohabitans TaxID=796027 RepID=A0A167CNJ2_9ASCO|nr:Bud3p [Sugiyamaella lignohabitans]ANB11924.1 Bud3p [Sugiyamaella lignohabitans]